MANRKHVWPTPSPSFTVKIVLVFMRCRIHFIPKSKVTSIRKTNALGTNLSPLPSFFMFKKGRHDAPPRNNPSYRVQRPTSQNKQQPTRSMPKRPAGLSDELLPWRRFALVDTLLTYHKTARRFYKLPLAGHGPIAHFQPTPTNTIYCPSATAKI
jgi:hypothetical protein